MKCLRCGNVDNIEIFHQVFGFGCEECGNEAQEIEGYFEILSEEEEEVA